MHHIYLNHLSDYFPTGLGLAAYGSTVWAQPQTLQWELLGKSRPASPQCYRGNHGGPRMSVDLLPEDPDK
jgi:hypothetical protein